MEKVICANGHFYDGDKYKECPHCAEGKPPARPSAFSVERGPVQERPESGKAEEKRKLFGRRAKDRRSREHRGETQQNAGVIEEKMQGTDAGGDHGTMILRQDMAVSEENSEKKERISEQYSYEMPVQNYQENEQVTELIEEGGQNEGETIGFFSAGLDKEPPVGYLICIAGEDYGTGFPLKSGNNTIGRSGSMDVVVLDVKVSREKQAYIVYEPHKREFFLKPGDSSGLCYLNDELLLEPKKLQAYDEILLGDTKLMLIPICGEKFSWKEMIS